MGVFGNARHHAIQRVSSPAMTITVNGTKQDVAPGTSVLTLLEARKLSPDKVAVELNRRLLRTEKYAAELKDGDEVEIVTFVGGG